MHKLQERRTREDRGAAAVEFALVVPLLLVIVFGIINFGVVLSQQVSLNNAARQAARFAVVDGRDCTAVEDEARDAVPALDMQRDDPTIAITREGSPAPCDKPCTASDPGDSVTVTMTFESELIIPIPPFPGSIDLTGEGTMRCEFS